MEKKINQLAAYFKGYKMTHQRRLVLEVFLENRDKHLSADEIYYICREKDSDIGLATIYRSLDLLEELGLVNKINFGDGRSRYEFNSPQNESHHHHHLVCLKCQDILEVKEDLLHQLEEVIEKENKFKIVDHRVQFFGHCVKCQEEEKNK